MNTISFSPRLILSAWIAVATGLIAAPVGSATKKHAPVHAVAVLSPTDGSGVRGTVRFVETGAGVAVTADVEGLRPGATHAWHIHEYGDTRNPAGKATGGHFNPDAHPHALPTHDVRHAGDLGNLTADERGRAHVEVFVTNITLTPGKTCVLGRGVIVHAKPDDGGQPTGNAGARLAQGVIALSGS